MPGETKAKHAPGPWHMAGPVGAGIWIQSDASPNIAAVHGAATDTGRANARLIAAAPDLLAALKDALINVCGECCPAFSEDGEHSERCAGFRDLITKAGGKP